MAPKSSKARESKPAEEAFNPADLVTQVNRDDDPKSSPAKGKGATGVVPGSSKGSASPAKGRKAKARPPMLGRFCKCFGASAMSPGAKVAPRPSSGKGPTKDSDGRSASTRSPSTSKSKSASTTSPSGTGTAVAVAPAPKSAAAKANALIPPQEPRFQGRKLLILDLDETLVHSSFRPIDSPDIFLSIEMNGQTLNVYVAKRPGVDTFLSECAKIYEVVVWTASLAKYADPLMDILDPQGHVTGRLFRPHCTKHNGVYVKDLARLGRSLDDVLIIDNSPLAYSFHIDNAIPIKSWYDDTSDRELHHLLPILNGLSQVESIPSVLRSTRTEMDGGDDER
mmetsp:Transcript_38957/g.89255  ORF Transcript_38957/g.89255 Transcript_38957/m.89255 type:complete len:338 (-) Transcript_38957:289-1302(-)